MLLPIRTNVWPRRTPYANYALIAINVIVFLLSYGGPYTYRLEGQPIEPMQLMIRPWAANWLLIPAAWHIWQFLTYAFLHGSYMHIIGNMFFLYLFGNNINDKLGHFWYVVFYLAGAILSGVGHTLVNVHSFAPTLGASGAVAAVTGAYLVLFPQTLITVLYWFFFIGTIEVPALYLILLKMVVFDNIVMRQRGVANDAHLAGYAYGIAVTLLLLATRIIHSSQFDLWAMLKRWNRRRLYRDSIADGYDPFTGMGGRRTVQAKEIPPTAVDAQTQTKIDRIRLDINKRIGQRNLPAAAELYLQLMELDPTQVLPRQYLLDIANQLASDHHPPEAAKAYEQFLSLYGGHEYAEQVELMLGILYARYLNKPQEAKDHLQKAGERLTDPNQRDLCRQELTRLA
jgi:membrane associated rhomboid family serine protease